MNVNNIIDTINIVAQKIFSSVEGELYPLLDKIIIITPDILKQEPLKNMFFEDKNVAMTLVATSFIVFFVVCFVLSRLISMYSGREVENIWQSVIRLVICSILMSTSYYICKQILNINSIFTEIVSSAGKDITGQSISFESFRETITDLGKYMSSDFISIDGMIKGLISFGTITLVLNFSIRYVTIIFLLLISPIAFMLAASDVTIDIFKSWLKLLVTNLLIQSVVIIIISIPLAFNKINNVMFKIVLVGTIYMLYRLNNIIKELLGNISRNTNKLRRG